VSGNDERIAVVFSWSAPDGSRTSRAQLLTFRNGRITAIRDYARVKRALRAATST
jgi:ketosteroid isomerase-like protein